MPATFEVDGFFEGKSPFWSNVRLMVFLRLRVFVLWELHFEVDGLHLRLMV